MITAAVLVVAVAAVVAVLAYVLLARSPEATAGHRDAAPDHETTAERLYGGTERPAGPDAESQRPEPPSSESS